MLITEVPEEIGLSSRRLGNAYQLLHQAVAKGSLMGAAIQVVRRGVALKPKCLGRRELSPKGAPVETDTIFLTASVTKPVTATATMLLVEQGKLSLNDPVASIVPEFGKRGKERVLIHHLLTHTSGLPDMLPENQELRARHAPLDEFIQRICEVKLLFPPGTNVSYQSCGVAMLSEVVKRIEGIPLREFMHREIFQPLGMEDTSLGVQEDKVDRVSKVNIPEGAFPYGSREVDWNWNSSYWWRFAAPWGGMFSTVKDMAVFCQMFEGGGRHRDTQVLSPATVAVMTADHVASMPDIPVNVRLSDPWGLGWRLKPPYGSAFGDLVSRETYGHSGATGTLVWVDPKLHLICIIFTNQPEAGERVLTLCSNTVAGSVVEP